MRRGELRRYAESRRPRQSRQFHTDLDVRPSLELRYELAEFRERCNQRWTVQFMDYLAAQTRQQLLAPKATA